LPKVIGVDLAVPGKGRTGLAVVDTRDMAIIELRMVREAAGVRRFVKRWAPHIVVVDAPLGLPRYGGFREAERWAMRYLGARLLPLTLRPMRMLAEAAARLRRELPWADIMETHPASSVRIAGASDAAELIACLGVAIPGIGLANKDLVDAAVAAVTGALIAHGEAVLYGSDTALVFPRPGLCRGSGGLVKSTQTGFAEVSSKSPIQ